MRLTGLWLALTLVLPGTAAAQIVDGIAAVVDDEIISIGQVRRAATLLQEAAVRGAFPQCAEVPPGEETATLNLALECLIDTTLVYREVRRFPQLLVTDNEIDARIAALRDELGTATFADHLRRWQLTEAELREVIRRQLLVAAYIDNRFRTIVQVSDEELLRVWHEELAPDMAARGIEVPPFEQVAEPLVRPLLQEREINRLVQSWVSDLRRRAVIERRFP